MKKLITILAFNLILVCGVTAQLGWVGNMFPSGGGHSLTENTNHNIYIQAYKAGVTEPAGQGAGINCEVYYGEVAVFGGAWSNITSLPMTYNVDIGNNDEYTAALNLSAGLYEYTCRCSDDGGATWFWQGGSNAEVEFTVSLPVELIDFNVADVGNEILLNWSTASELNNDYFTIEKSSDGEDFSAIGMVEGAGNSLDKLNYSFIDNEPILGMNYYRLVQTDFDGTTSYSEVLTINKAKKKSLVVSLFPNPTSSNIIITTDSEDLGMVQIFSARGELVYQGIHNLDSRMDIGLEELSTGLYFIHISNENTKETLHSSSFVKE